MPKVAGKSGYSIRARGFGPALLFELKITQRQIKIITNAKGMPMLAMPKIVRATSESRFPLDDHMLRTDMMLLPSRGFRSSPRG
jgi:hypothetical protein